MFPVHSRPNGNCLYNSFSIILFDDEDEFYIIKACSIYILLKYEQFFSLVLQKYKYGFCFKDFVASTCRRSEWGCELNILAIAILLEKQVYCYNKKTRKNLKSRVKYSTKQSNCPEVRIGICDSHFFPILVKGDNNELPSIETEFLSQDLKHFLSNSNNN
jgi:hypothetical protein